MNSRSFLRAIALTLSLGLASTTFAADKSPSASRSKSETTAAATGRIDLNTADAATLQTLPGVGPATAAAIIQERPFKSVDELERVRGIGPEKLRDLRPLVRVSAADAAPKKSPTRESRDATTTRDTPRETSATPPARRNVTTPSADRPVPATSGTNSTRREQPRDERGRFISRDAQLVNLNTATRAELEALPEIGPVKAQAIIDARPFSSIEDVMRVKGIKEGTFEQIKDRITVR
jgi:competence protein ComEA